MINLKKHQIAHGARAFSLMGLFALSFGAGLVHAQTTLRISSAAVETDLLTTALKHFKSILEKSAPGRFDVKVYPNSALFKQGTEVPALQRGNLEMSTMSAFEVDQQIPEFSVYDAGYAFRDSDHMLKVFSGPLGKEYFKKVEAVMGIKILNTFYLGTRQVNLRTERDVKTPQDLRGVKLRVPAGPGWLALGRGLGSSPTPMAASEIYLGLSTGTIDGQENPLGVTKAAKLDEVTKQVVLTGHMVQPVFLSIGLPAWNKLSNEDKASLEAAARSAAEYNNSNRVKDERELVAYMQSKGLKVTTPDVNAFKTAMAKHYVETGLSKQWPAGVREQIDQVK